MLKLIAFVTLIVAISAQVRDARYNRYVPPAAYRPYRYNPVVTDAEIARRAERPYIVDESPKPYSFSYSAPAEEGVGQSSRNEVADGTGKVEGSYSLTNEEGHTRVVEYVADADGFRANIRTNEPGTANESPASVVMESTGPYTHSAINYNPEIRGYTRPRPYRPIQPGLVAAGEPVAPIVPATAAEEHVDDPRLAVGQPTPNLLYRRPYQPARNAYRRPVYY